MLFNLDTNSTIPLYRQLSDSIRQGITRGDLKVGERLPATRDLAKSLGINMHTVLRAYNELRDDSTLDVRRGRGAIIKRAPIRIDELDVALNTAIELARKNNVPAQQLIDQISNALNSRSHE